jgi:hypothetical protein
VALANKAFGRFWTTVFYGLWVLMSFYRVVAKLLHQKPGFVDQNFFFAKTSSKPGFDTSTSFFQ